jgi:hypothetical protein
MKKCTLFSFVDKSSSQNLHKMLPLQNVDLSRPLLPENLDGHFSQRNIFPESVVEETPKIQTNRSNSLPRIHGIADTSIQGIPLGKPPLLCFPVFVGSLNSYRITYL